METYDEAKDQLLRELPLLRRRVAELEANEGRLLEAGKKLQEKESLLRAILASSPVGIVHTQGSRITWANRAWEEMFRFRNEQEYLDLPTRIMYRTDAEYEWARETLYENCRGGEVSETETVLVRKDCSVFDAHVRISMLDPDDPAKGTISTIIDISAGKAAEQSQEIQRRRFEILCENSPFAMMIVQSDGRFVYANPKFEEMFGYRLDEVPTGKDWLKKAYPDSRYRSQVASAWIEDFKNAGVGETRPRVFTVTCKDGSEKIILFRPVRLDSGEDLTTCQDITEIKRAEEETNRTKILLDSIIENLPTAVFLKEAQQLQFVIWNKACENLYGYKKEQMVGKTARDVFCETDAERFEAQDRAVLQSRRLLDIPEQHVTTSKNEVRILATRKVPVVGMDGNPTHLLGIGEDITLRKTAEMDLLQAKELAEKASRAKSEFLANMSHEIRTPMNGILGMTELALNTELTDEQREYLEAVKVSGDSLLTLINDILDFSKIEAGKLELVPIDFSLRDCVANTLITLAAIAHKKGLELIYNIPPEIPDALRGDPGRLRQILVNLVGNSVKFTEKGEVAVTVQMESETDSQICLRFSVTDTGIGIPAEKQQRIFDAFEQADGSTTRKYGGTGLGLAVSTQLVRMMEGNIWVESEVGRGSTFRFTVRLGVQTEPAGMTMCVESSSLKDLPVLVVDDNATNRRVLSQMLAGWHMKPAAVDHANAAVEEMKRAHAAGSPFKLVLIDYMMPDTDGFQLAGHIKSHAGLAESILIMLTSAGERGHAAKCVELGIAAYLMKPVRQSELFEIICSSIQKSGRGKTRPALLTRHAIRESKRRMHALLAEDNPINQKLAVRLLQKMGHNVTVAKNGREALNAFVKDQFDVILMDIQMPEMDGFEATAAIRAREKTHNGKPVPILAMTAHAMAGDRERCLEAGMDGYLSKPIKLEELVKTLEGLCGGERSYN